MRLERDQAFLAAALDAELDAARGLSVPDRALATELSYGAMRRRLRLDHAIAASSDRPLSKIDPVVMAALRLGVYQLLYLERVPAHAAVNETLESLKRAGASRATGFVNGALRNIGRHPGEDLAAVTDPVERLAIEESHPRWLIDRWIARMGFEQTTALCQANNAAPPICLRVNPLRGPREELLDRFEEEGLSVRASPVSPLGLRLQSAGAVANLPGFKQGLFQVQDDAAQLVALLAGGGPGQRTLDVCAAPGAKTCAFTAQAGGTRVIAVDIHAAKLGRINNEASRLGVADRIRLVCADASRPLPFKAEFDQVVVDAPCSGLGTLRRHPELRYRRSASDLPRLAELQGKILGCASAHVRPGGVLTYAVCSPEPEEGVDQVRAFLEGHPDFRRAEAPPGFTARLENGDLCTWPHRDGCDAFFASRLRRHSN